MKYVLLLLIIFSFGLNSCEKDQNRSLLNAFFRYTIKGNETVIHDGAGLNNDVFDCTFRGDTLLLINVAKIYEGVGFVLKSPNITDGTYTLDSVNRAYYSNPLDQKRYYTTSKFKGTLTIKKGTFQAKDLLNTLEGTFSFQAVDTLSGKNFTIENGSFLMERKLLH